MDILRACTGQVKDGFDFEVLCFLCIYSYLEAFIVIHVFEVMVQNMHKNPRLIREHHVALVCQLIQINHANTDFLVSPMHVKEHIKQGQLIITTDCKFSLISLF